MDTLLAEIGLSEAEIAVYNYLLTHATDTAAIIASHVGQTRTNTYMVLNKLVESGIVEIDESSAVRRYSAANPSILQQQVRQRQQALARTGKSLEMAMPDLLAMFNLTQHKPGVVYMQGYEGLKSSFEDQAKSKTDLLLWGSDIVNRDPKVWQIIENGGYKRRARGIKTKCLFHSGAPNWPHIQDFALKGFDIRLWGDKPFAGEVLIYDNRVTFTTYAPEIIVTILTNDTMADTFRTIFEQCWAHAEQLPPR